ncbi:hypothetical protein DFH11DRAFT_1630100 [Phellopilus nigrolimitatus]|nr:hypothetical protein DFH11DRAFT_1630100 [Phellopilus nigrolimitatus]
MRRRSSTVTKTRARSVSVSTALALCRPCFPNKAASLESLPTELLFHIVLLAAAAPPNPTGPHARRLGSAPRAPAADSDSADESKAESDSASSSAAPPPPLDRHTLRALALTSRALAAVAHAVLYRAVSLHELAPAERFARTVLAGAHRGLTLAAASSSSPVALTFPFFPPGPLPAPALGKSTTRLVLSAPPAPPHNAASAGTSPARLRAAHERAQRFGAAAGALLALGPAAPSAPSPVLAALRTLVVQAHVLAHLARAAHAHAHAPPHVVPAPSELILDTCLPAPAAPDAPSTADAPLAPLAARLTHLVLARPPQKWARPSASLAALAGAPALTHLALARRAHANEDNDAEFARDVAAVLSSPARAGTLTCVVLVVQADAAYAAWRDAHPDAGGDPAEDGDARDEETRALEAYLAPTHIWARLAALARDVAPPAAVCVVPGRGDAWPRALRNAARPGPRFDSAVFLEGQSGDLWEWARTYELGRRAREAW